MANLGMRYITRPRTRGVDSGFWWVRFYTGTYKGKDYVLQAQKTFPDSRYGDDPQRSLRAAQRWRTIKAKELGKYDAPYKGLERYRTAPRSNTGSVGVCNMDYVDSNGRHRTYYQAYWSETLPDGKRKPRTKSFSYPPHDDQRKADQLRAAKRWRKRKEKEHYTGRYESIKG